MSVVTMEFLEKIDSLKAVDFWKLIDFTVEFFKAKNPTINQDIIMSNIPYIYFEDISFVQALKICSISESRSKREFNKFKESFPFIMVNLRFRNDKKYREEYELSTFNKLFNTRYLNKKD